MLNFFPSRFLMMIIYVSCFQISSQDDIKGCFLFICEYNMSYATKMLESKRYLIINLLQFGTHIDTLKLHGEIKVEHDFTDTTEQASIDITLLVWKEWLIA